MFLRLWSPVQGVFRICHCRELIIFEHGQYEIEMNEAELTFAHEVQDLLRVMMDVLLRYHVSNVLGSVEAGGTAVRLHALTGRSCRNGGNRLAK